MAWCPPHPPQNVPLHGAARSCPVPPCSPRWLLQLPTEDGAYGYGATLPPELFEDDAADGDGGEARAGGFVRGCPPPTPVPQTSPCPLCAAGAVLEASARSVAYPYPFLVAGGSLLLGIALFIAILVR